MVGFKRINLINYIIHMSGKIVGAIVVVIVVVGGWYLLSSAPAEAPGTAVTNDVPVIGSTTPETAVGNTAPEVSIIYNDQGFSPKSVTVPLGTVVTFTNQSSVNMWVASAMHPTHIVYSGTSLNQHCPDTTKSAFDECKGEAPGASYSFTFNKAGTWKYHDHVDASKFGSVTVTTAAASATAAAETGI